MRDDNGVEQALAKAEDGYASISRLLVHIENEEQRNEIERRLEELRIRLDGLRSRLSRTHECGGRVMVPRS